MTATSHEFRGSSCGVRKSAHRFRSVVISGKERRLSGRECQAMEMWVVASNLQQLWAPQEEVPIDKPENA